VKRFGWLIMAAAVVVGVVARILGQNTANFDAALGLCLLLGIALWGIDAAIRMFRGKLAFRPLDAIKRACVLLLVLALIRGFLWFFFPSMHQDIAEAIFVSVLTALCLGFYSTAYRSPA